MTELHRIRELLRLAGTSQGHWVQPLLKQGQLGRTLSKQLLIVFLEETLHDPWEAYCSV